MAAVSESMWSALESGVDLHKRLASALGDAQYFDESIAPSEIRRELQKAGTTDTTVLVKAMKWLLASISKGRDVVEFYPDVIKLVACPNLEVRKMVYTYMLHNQHSDSKLSLLSINSFQRGLSDAEPLIRAMALRALTSVQLQDILQIQILAISKHARNDASPYVRKYAAMAIAKVADRCQAVDQRQLLLELVEQMLDHEPATMVLSSAVTAFFELTNGGEVEYLSMLHGSFRKLCTLLTDMDEWGQVVSIEVLMRYCRHFFRAPDPCGSAEQIDASRRVIRDKDGNLIDATTLEVKGPATNEESNSILVPWQKMSVPRQSRRRIIKRRVVKKGFYSDEEDESTEEEIFADTLEQPISAPKDEPEVSGADPTAHVDVDEEEKPLDDDHKRLLHAAMPLLKSRNAGVVLAVCALQYYCGVSSVRVRKALGKALVRIHRHSETQYVVLSSIRRLVRQCPSAFSPFLHDFFVLQMDPPQTKLVKLHILTSLALDPPSINTVLEELRAYVQIHPQDKDDVEFVGAAIQSVGRVAELARICYERQGRGQEAISILLNCLFGLLTLSQVSPDFMVVGEAVVVMQRLLRMIGSESISDPNRVRQRAIARLLGLLVYTLSQVAFSTEDNESDEISHDNGHENENPVENSGVVLPPDATAAALGYITSSLPFGSDLFQGISEVRAIVTRLLLSGYLLLESAEKEQALLLASKVLALEENRQEGQICEQILALGRLDTNNVVRERARYVSSLVNATLGMTFETDSLDLSPGSVNADTRAARDILLSLNCPPSHLPIEKEDEFRFGSLSSMVGHRVASSYLALPIWAEEDSPGSVRDEAQPKGNEATDTRLSHSSSSSGSSSSDSSSSLLDQSSGSNSSDSDSLSDTDSSDSNEVNETWLPRANPPLSVEESSIRSKSESSESSGSSSDDDTSESKSITKPKFESPTGKLIQLDTHYPTGLRSVDNDLKGLIIESPKAQNTNGTEPDLESSDWFQVLRPEHANGLSLQARFLRGQVKREQLLLLGVSVVKPAIICLQFRFENAAGKPPQRRVQIIQRTSASSGSLIGAVRIVAPRVIDALAAGQKSETCMAIEFQSLSDRDGSYSARLEVKTGSCRKPIEIKPSIGEMLQPSQVAMANFDRSMERMQGFNRVQSTYEPPSSFVAKQVCSAIALVPVRGDEQDSGTWRFVGALPSSGDLVYVLVDSIQGKIAVCSDHALVINPIMKLVKDAVNQ